MRALVFVAVVVACKGSTAPPTPSATPASETEEVDALWKLAPTNTMVGIVISHQALNDLERAWTALEPIVRTTAEGARALDELPRRIGTDKLTLDAFGLSHTKGAALFVMDTTKAILIIPVADKAKFLRMTKGKDEGSFDRIDDLSCKTVHDVYACTDDKTAAFDRIGTGAVSAAAVKARGGIEFSAIDVPIGAMKGTFAGAFKLDHGAFALHAIVRNLAPAKLAVFGPPSTPQVDPATTTGFAMLHLAPLFAMMPELPHGDVVRAIADPITMTTTSSSFAANVPLGDPAPVKQLFEAECTSDHDAKLVDGACVVTSPLIADLVLRARATDKALVVDMPKAAAPAQVVATELGKELAGGTWQDVIYGRGSAFAAVGLLKAMWPALPAEEATGIRAMILVDELGLGLRVDGDALRIVAGVRTVWHDAPEVTTQVLALDPQHPVEGQLDAIVKQAPGSQLAHDVRAGYLGLAIPLAALGVFGGAAETFGE